MLNEHERELLTGFVDGELPESQRAQVRRLLEQSAEARRVLERLQHDAAALRRLEVPALDRDLSEPIVERLARRASVGSRRRLPTAPPASPAWAGMVAAAAVLLVLSSATYLYFSTVVQPNQPGPPLTKNEPDEAATDDVMPIPLTPVSPQEWPRAEEKPKPDAVFPPAPVPPQPPAVAVKPLGRPEAKPPQPSPAPPREVIAAPSMEMFELKTVTVQPPTVLRLQQMEREGLLAELKKDSIFRLELPCRNASRAFDRVQSDGRSLKLDFVIDQFAQGRLKAPQMRTHYAVFVEGLMPEQIGDLLEKIAGHDRASAREADAIFDRVVLARLSEKDRKNLAELLGFDHSQPPSLRSLGPFGTDPSRPLSELTAAQVSESLAGQGGKGRSEAGKSLPRPAGHPALVLAFSPTRPRGTSAEVLRYQALRKPSRTGTVQILLVLRSTGI